MSPTIKVIYPSQAAEKSDAPASSEVVEPIKQSLPTAPQPQQVEPVQTTTVTDTGSISVAPVTPAATTAPKWLDVVKQNSTLFLIVFVVAVGVGVVIGKKI